MQKLKFFIPALAWLAIITGLSTMPGIQLPQFSLISADKLAHMFVYGVLVWLVIRGFRQMRKAHNMPLTWKTGLLAFSLAVAYGVLMEYAQYAFIPGRFYEIDDMIANTIGAAAGWAMARLV